jgi:membrane protein
VTAFLFEGTKSLITLYLAHVRTDFFGQAASFAVLMIWLYVSALLLFFGAEFTEVWARRRGRKLGPGEEKQATPAFTLKLDHELRSRLLAL